MATDTPTPLVSAPETVELEKLLASIQKIVDDAKADRDRLSHIAATIRINALHYGASGEEAEAFVRGDADFIGWVIKVVDARRTLPDALAATSKEPPREGRP